MLPNKQARRHILEFPRSSWLRHNLLWYRPLYGITYATCGSSCSVAVISVNELMELKGSQHSIMTHAVLEQGSQRMMQAPEFRNLVIGQALLCKSEVRACDCKNVSTAFMSILSVFSPYHYCSVEPRQDSVESDFLTLAMKMFSVALPHPLITDVKILEKTEPVWFSARQYSFCSCTKVSRLTAILKPEAFAVQLSN